MKQLTISIAAYNVENTLEQTLKSMNDERVLDDLEVLIIDDGSKDNTYKIAEKYQKIAPQTFKYIKKKNGGHGSTINKGIELATGKYFKVVDGDDWVDTETLVTFINSLKSLNSDLVLTNHVEVFPDRIKKISLIQGMVPNKEYSWKSDIDVKRVVLHNLTVKTELLKANHVKITEHCFYVDVEFVIWAAYISKTITYLDIFLYQYRLGEEEQSVAKKSMLKNVDMQEKVAYKLVSLFDKFYKQGFLSSNQEKTIFNTYKRSVGSTMRTFLLMKPKEARKRIIHFDKKINNVSTHSYKSLEKDKFIHLIRMGNYSLIPLAKILYRIWVLKYGY